jgi:hypothetical protein
MSVQRRSGRQPVPRPFPLAPLLEASGLRVGGALARRVHRSGHDIRFAAAHGLSWQMADAWRVRLGFHPGQVWPEWTQLEDAA